ncbi:MAG: hypothetical protein AzoDbin1_04113 [Azoarcus sp.]|nr:hypothetical protein [Azoarcus sp.]
MNTLRTLPDQIEIFRPGRHIDDAGGVHEFSDADVAAMVEAYDPAVREAPLTVGHPQDNRPAYGWVKGLARNEAGRLVMDTHQVEPQFAEMVDRKLFKKRSASFYPPSHPNNPTPGKWYLRHVAFLGAQPPAIAGLKDFADDSAGAISFSEGEPAQSTQEHTMTKEEQEALARAEKAEGERKAADEARIKAEADATAANTKLAQFAEAARNERHAGFVSFAEAQVKAGKLLPKDKDAAVAVLDVLADAQPVEFAEAGATKKLAPAEWLKGLIDAAKPVVNFGEFAPGNAAGQGAAGLSDAEIDKRAKAYAQQHKVNYAEALSAVVNFTS